MDNKFCIIMAGGIGSRFWPVSRNSKPKQFLDILGIGKTFLQITFERFTKIIPEENILIVTSANYKDLVKEQLPQIKDENILLEPYRRNTAPCIAYATYKLLKRNPDATVIVAPSDHLILNEDIFLETIKSALNYASNNMDLLTLGIKPSRAETGYGYIQCNMGSYKLVDGNTAYNVKTFTEKPDEELAKVFLKSGEFLWNSGIFIWSLKAIEQEMEAKLPEIAKLFKEGVPHYYTDNEVSYINSIYEICPSISIDYGVMEKTDKAWVFQASFGWSDLGTWDSLYLQLDKDDKGNMIKGEEIVVDKVANSIIVSEEKNKLVVVKGLEEYMVVNTDDVLMICPKNIKDFKDLMTDLVVNHKAKYQ